MYKQIAETNAANLKSNAYPGRGIVLGATEDGRKLAQIYWIMGRSENSRNRVFQEESGFVRTRAFDESKLTDPSLIIYYPVKHHQDVHVVSNGDQTDTVIDYLKAGKSWQEALMTRTFEPDAPNYTPRITGIMDLKAPWAYALSILKSQDGDEGHCLRHFYFYEKALYGYGHCIHTYQGDGNPLPSFSGEPYIMPVPENPEKACQLYWSLLNEENRISLLAKYIDVETGKFEIRMINRHGA
ncbi:MAG TPA: IMP cyclohydrolase [Thermoclostridium caenicola]|uniref:IMP cyclohydrolase n=1 Tax=Thermoclostridium caenicola TaxID=659425 RepID=UPI002C7BA692|nr:IMP cyclohydrolase [Thermoclostridium caenicola]HOL84173.1 IMP cyclohydrolase [Thermoclostridium caenicola]HPO76246.1 IMP cyclohydrolase [Thermoclostridium caenicola]